MGPPRSTGVPPARSLHSLFSRRSPTRPSGPRTSVCLLVAAFNPFDPGFSRGDALVGGGNAIGGIALVLGAVHGPVMLASPPLIFLYRIKGV